MANSGGEQAPENAGFDPATAAAAERVVPAGVANGAPEQARKTGTQPTQTAQSNAVNEVSKVGAEQEPPTPEQAKKDANKTKVPEAGEEKGLKR